MGIYNKLENTIDKDKSIQEQLEALSIYDKITNVEIEEITKTCHKSKEAGILIEYLGHNRLKKYLPDFLEFLKDINWPAAHGAARMLTKAGKQIIPEIKRVLKEEYDPTWHMWIAIHIVNQFDIELISELKPQLVEIVERADFEGASIEVFDILITNHLLSDDETKKHLQYLESVYQKDDYLSESLKELIKSIANN